MVVQHNLTAMNANRMLGITTGQQAKSSEKLSSGYRINRAADDAAGLTISEKMRKQIKGLSQASTNAQDGVSCVQTAEGALNEVHSMLQRMNELAVQSSNGTNSATDREAIQAEIDQLATEIDRVSETTKFNETYLLKGSNTANTNTKTIAANGIVGIYNGIEVKATAQKNLTTGDQITLGTVGLAAADGKTTVDADGANAAASDITSIKVTDTKANVVISFADGTKKSMTATEMQTAYGIKAVADGETTLKKSLTNKGATADYAFTPGTSTNLGSYKVGETVDVKVNVADNGSTSLYNATAPKNPLQLNLHVGADSEATNKISLTIESMDATTLGIREAGGNAISVSTETDATKSIDTIAAAIAKVSSQRSALGAVQNRLEHTIANLDNVVENTTAAESRIRDTDMAEEMVEYSKNNILAQAGQSMLAQANQSTQGVLSLLQ